jgi:dCMP deaminase
MNVSKIKKRAQQQQPPPPPPPPAPMRISWEKYFMNLARVISTRSTCSKLQVGAVIVRDKTILSTGYNGAISGLPHCNTHGHKLSKNSSYSRDVHAEQNAIAQAARNGTSINKAEMFVTVSPCWNCFKIIANSGIKKIYFLKAHEDREPFLVASSTGIKLFQIIED